jgi:hypothetical protein
MTPPSEKKKDASSHWASAGAAVLDLGATLRSKSAFFGGGSGGAGTSGKAFASAALSSPSQQRPPPQQQQQLFSSNGHAASSSSPSSSSSSFVIRSAASFTSHSSSSSSLGSQHHAIAAYRTLRDDGKAAAALLLPPPPLSLPLSLSALKKEKASVAVAVASAAAATTAEAAAAAAGAPPLVLPPAALSSFTFSILTVFEKRLSDNIGRLGFAKILEPANVRRVVEEADGYQPHLIAPEMGYRRLLQECLALFAKPADTAVDETHAILRQIVAATLDSPQCAALSQYAHLRHAIARTAAASLDGFKADARAMVNTLVEMERSYLTAEVFKEILHQSGRSAESGELIRTLSGRGVGDAVAGDDGMLPSSSSSSSPADRHLHRIAVHVSAYITHVRTQLKQTIPKAIVHTLVMKAKKQLLDGLQREVAAADDGGLKRMLSEDDATVRRREQCVHRLKLLRQAADEVAACSF